MAPGDTQYQVPQLSRHRTIRLVGVAWPGGAGVTAEVTRQAAAKRFPDHQPQAAGDHCTS
jgi:hypothetical protein